MPRLFASRPISGGAAVTSPARCDGRHYFLHGADKAARRACPWSGRGPIVHVRGESIGTPAAGCRAAVPHPVTGNGVLLPGTSGV